MCEYIDGWGARLDHVSIGKTFKSIAGCLIDLLQEYPDLESSPHYLVSLQALFMTHSIHNWVSRPPWLDDANFLATQESYSFFTELPPRLLLAYQRVSPGLLFRSPISNLICIFLSHVLYNTSCISIHRDSAFFSVTWDLECLSAYFSWACTSGPCYALWLK
jgi:hypothetical protein